MAQVAGAGVCAIFQHETGGHRWQRLSPAEKHGRVHTSTVTVAVLALPSGGARVVLRDADLVCTTTTGTGPGGQARNKTQSCVQLTHVPSGISVRCDVHRSQHQNRALARQWLEDRLAGAQARVAHEALNTTRRAGIGSGQRGDKIRTIRCQDGVVTDHRTGQRWPLRRYLAGDWETACPR